MLCSHLLHDLHRKLVMIGSNIRCGINRCQLMLRGRNLIMLGLCKDAELPELLVEILHISGYTGLDDTKIMVIHLLSLGRLRAKERASGVYEIFSFVIHFSVNKEIFLLGTDRACNTLYGIVSEKLQNTESLHVECLHRTKQWSLLIKSLATIGAECCRNTQRLSLDKCVRGRIPSSIASCLKGSAKSSRGERRCIGLTLDQLLARKFHNDSAIGSR